jgi:hypothetical protein
LTKILWRKQRSTHPTWRNRKTTKKVKK